MKKEDISEITLNGSKVRTAAVQPQKIAAPCINDRFSRGTAAVEGCVPRPKGELCKGRFLRRADVAGGCEAGADPSRLRMTAVSPKRAFNFRADHLYCQLGQAAT